MERDLQLWTFYVLHQNKSNAYKMPALKIADLKCKFDNNKYFSEFLIMEADETPVINTIHIPVFIYITVLFCHALFSDFLPLPVFDSLLYFSQVMHNKCSFMNEAHVVYSTPTTFYIIHLAVGCVTDCTKSKPFQKCRRESLHKSPWSFQAFSLRLCWDLH